MDVSENVGKKMSTYSYIKLRVKDIRLSFRIKNRISSYVFYYAQSNGCYNYNKKPIMSLPWRTEMVKICTSRVFSIVLKFIKELTKQKYGCITICHRLWFFFKCRERRKIVQEKYHGVTNLHMVKVQSEKNENFWNNKQILQWI